MTKVSFIGAGPGDPELITIKGQKAVRQADVIIYAGSLVPKAVVEDRKPEAEVLNSASMNLEKIMETIRKAHEGGKDVARVHTGDPSIYGSIREQMEELDKQGIAYEVIPGVSAFGASAAALKKEFTVPGISQTVILTRMEGRTPVPEQEQIEKLAAHQASMAIFLTVQMIDKLVDKLLLHYPSSTPVAVVQRASWPDEKIVTGMLSNIVEAAESSNITKTAMILVGDFLGQNYQNSLLYARHFTHAYRQGKKS